MIGLDTNILVRYFAQDDAGQSALANRLMGTLTKDEPGFVSAVVLCELVWVLEDVYGLEKSALCNILRTLLVQRSGHRKQAGRLVCIQRLFASPA